jgi:hypothetical protein
MAKTSINWLLNEMTIPSERNPLRLLMNAFFADTSTLQNTNICALLNSGALAITGGGSTTAKIASTIYATTVSPTTGLPVLVTKTTTNMAALAGSVANAAFNVFVFVIDSAGALTTLMGTAGTTLGLMQFPLVPANKTAIGFVIINPTGSGAFVGGTTALDDATVVPNAVYVNTVGEFNPAAVLTVGT